MVQFCYLRPYLGFGTVSCRLLLRIARIDMDCFHAMPAEIAKKLLQLVLPDDSYLISCS